MGKQILVKYFTYCYYGSIAGLFICTKEELEASYEQTAVFGEVLGKHSEVSDYLTNESFEILSEDDSDIAVFIKLVGHGFGYNPLEYINQE